LTHINRTCIVARPQAVDGFTAWSDAGAAKTCKANETIAAYDREKWR
jgi:hypothetical protein